MKKTKTLWIIIGIGVAVFTLIMIVSSVLETGERIRKVNEYLEYAFYALAVILFYVLLFNPIRIILFSPSFKIVTVDDDNEHNYRIYKRLVKNLLEGNVVTDEDKRKLQSCETSGELKEELAKVYSSSIKKEINKIISNNAKTVLISTAICQNGKLDMYTVLSINIKMIKEIVVKCGFRPSYPKLGKLSFRVLSTALIAESLEGLDFNDIFPQSTTNALAEVPFIKPIAASLLGGISNALLTIRVGVVTRKYLFSEGQLTKDQIRVSAIKESLKIIPRVIKDVIAFFPSKIAQAIFKKPKDEEDTAS